MGLATTSAPLTATADGRPPVLVDAWYAQALVAPGVQDLEARLAGRFGPSWRRLAQRVGLVRGVLWYLVSRGAERLVCPFSARGLPLCLLLHRWLPGRPPRLYLVEFLRAEPRGLWAHVKEALHLALWRPLLRRLLDGAQVMTPWEAEAYAWRYRLPLQRFRHIAFPMLRHPAADLPPPAPARGVLASGRAACDWATLLAAAEGTGWPLTLVCSAEDRPAVDALNRDGRATVLSEISHEAHAALLAQAAVYALVLREQQASSGQVRLARAIEAGVPVVASAVRGLDGYAQDGVTALTVPAGDAAALRDAIGRLLDDAALHAALRQRAHAAMRERSLDAYVEQVRSFVLADAGPCRRIAFCGPIGMPGRPAGGGYEAANRRTCDALARRGQQVVELPYPHPARAAWRKPFAYAASFVRNGAWLLRRRADYDLLHLTPLNMHFSLAETLLVSCARLAGKPVLVDVRAGTFVRHYEGGSALYRRTIDRTLRLASEVAVEGPDHVAFVRRRTHRPVFLFPNYVDGPALQRVPPVRRLLAGETLRLVYFGRLVPEKGIEVALQALGLLVARGRAVTLELIGDGPAGFVEAMRVRHAALPVSWTAGLPAGELLERAAQAHVFLFPSRHDGEGHSNSLNEAMSLGLVPVCSAQGFSRSVVGNAGVVLPVGAAAEDYAAALEGLLDGERWAKLSARAAARVRALYSEEANLPALLDTYRQMLRR